MFRYIVLSALLLMAACAPGGYQQGGYQGGSYQQGSGYQQQRVAVESRQVAYAAQNARRVELGTHVPRSPLPIPDGSLYFCRNGTPNGYDDTPLNNPPRIAQPSDVPTGQVCGYRAAGRIYVDQPHQAAPLAAPAPPPREVVRRERVIVYRDRPASAAPVAAPAPAPRECANACAEVRISAERLQAMQAAAAAALAEAYKAGAAASGQGRTIVPVQIAPPSR